MMGDKRVLSKFLAALLIGLTGVVGTLLLLSREAGAAPMLGETNLAVCKSADPDPAIAGEVLTYVITVTNNGPHFATNVTLTDILPSGVTYISATPTSAGCNESGGTVTCTLFPTGTLGVPTATVDILVAVAPSATGTLTNIAKVSAREPEGTPNNTYTATTPVQAEADLAVAKADGPDPVTAGTRLTYTLTITNNGPSDATGVTVTDTLPSGVALASAGPDCDEADGTVTCTLSTLAYNDTATVTIVVTPTVEGMITNTATVSASVPDSAPGNNAYTVTTTVNPGADLALTKTGSSDPVIAGTDLTYTLTVTNNGPSAADSVTLTDTLPKGVDFGSSSPDCNEAEGTVTCDLGTIPSTDSRTVTITVEVPSSMAAGAITNTASVGTATADPNAGNNTASRTTTVETEADLTVTKTAAPDPVVAGTSLTYTLTVTNNGPSDATGVTVNDPLPAGVTFVLSTTSQGSYDSDTGVWAVGNLVDSETATLTIFATVNSSTSDPLSNSATVSGNETDPIPGNNTAIEGTAVDTEADLTIAKSAPATVDAGEPMTYTLTVTNSGPSDATGVTVTDTLPPEVDFGTASAGCNYNSTEHRVVCSVGPLVAESTATITTTVTVSSPLPDGTILTNSATIGGNESDPDAGNNSAQAQTTVHSAPILHVAKRDDRDPANTGGPLKYTIVISNTGNENATGATLVETYDPNVSFDSAWPIEPDVGDNQWNIGTVKVGTRVVIYVWVIVTDTLPVGTLLTNTVTLTSAQTAPITATEITSVDTVLELQVHKSDDPDPVQAGESLMYFIDYQAAGTAPAFDVVITETYDSRVTFVSASRPPVTGTNNVWYIGDLYPDDPSGYFWVKVDVKTPLPNGTILTNAVTIDSKDTDPRSYTETTRISSARDLALTVTDAPDPVEAGAPLIYTLRYTNTGNANATGVFITATLDSNVSFAGATPSPVGGSGQTRRWNVGTIPGEGGHGQIVITTSVTLPLADSTMLKLEAQLTDAEGDFLEEETWTEVNSAPVLSLQKSNGVDTVNAGDTLIYVLTYANSGNENAYDITITDTLPNYVTYVDCEIENGTCEPVPPGVPDEVVFHVQAITQTSGQARVVVQVVDPLPAGADAVANQARMSHPSLPTPIDAYDIDPIGTAPNLTMAAAHVPSLFSPGKPMTYFVTYGNAGQHADAGDVIITTILPTDTVYVGHGWDSSDGRTYTYAAGDLPADDTGHAVTFAVRHTGSAGIGAPRFDTPFTIAARVGSGRDENPGDNTVTVTVGVPDLVVVSCDVEPEVLQPHKPVTFTIVLKNQGAGWAWNPESCIGDPQDPTCAGFWVDVFIAPVASYPFERYSENNIYGGGPALQAGGQHTLILTYNGFSADEIENGIEDFYVKADNYHVNPYGLVPEFDEMNNVRGCFEQRSRRTYLPLVIK